MTEARAGVITRGERMLTLRRARMAASPPILRGGFRPFFFGAAAWAVIALALWLAALAGIVTLPSGMEPLAWHRHEMLFGFVGAAIAGFLLTAVPNWTGRLPIAGAPLATLFALWLAGRAALLFSASIGAPAAAVLDVGFYLVLAAVAAREVLASRNRNVPIVGLVLLFAIANAVDHAAAAGLVGDSELGVRAAISLIAMMISLIGGRIVPSFTRNWLAKRGSTGRLPGQPNGFDLAVLAASAVGLIAWIAAPEEAIAAILLVAAGLLQAARLGRWGGLRSIRDPLVFILHVGYSWVPLGLVLLGASLLGAPVPRSVAIHALTAGAMATMILAVMTRAALGHTGRPLVVPRSVAVAYLLLLGAALARVFGSALVPAHYLGTVETAALLWIAAFAIYVVVYAPILTRERADGKPG